MALDPPLSFEDQQNLRAVAQKATSDNTYRQHFELAVCEFQKVKTNGGVFRAMDINGNFQTCQVGAPISGWNDQGNPVIQGPVLYCRTLQETAGVVGTFFDPYVGTPGHNCLFWISERTIDQPSLTFCCGNPSNDITQKVHRWTQQWDESDVKNEISNILRANENEIASVTKIICFGLGDFTESSHACTQHLAVIHIWNVVSDIRKKISDPLKLLAAGQLCTQDPMYCSTARNELEKLGFEIVEDPMGFEMVGEHTFVISKYPSAPIRQLVTGLLKHVGGPVGMLCNKIVGNGIERDKSRDPSAPWAEDYASRCDILDVGEPKDEDEEEDGISEGVNMYLRRNR